MVRNNGDSSQGLLGVWCMVYVYSAARLLFVES